MVIVRAASEQSTYKNKKGELASMMTCAYKLHVVVHVVVPMWFVYEARKNEWTIKYLFVVTQCTLQT